MVPRTSTRRSLGGAEEKGGTRSWPNILANGGLAAVFGFGELVIGGSIFAVLFLGAISAAAADTAATEIGLLSRRPPRLITHPGELVPPGISGGVTYMGFLGAILASAIIGGIAAGLGVITGISAVVVVIIAAVGGFGGSVADSLAGALIQRKNVCAVCGQPSEGPVHCGKADKVQRRGSPMSITTWSTFWLRSLARPCLWPWRPRSFSSGCERRARRGAR